MPAIRITGMASGLPPNIVDQLVEAEKIPVKEMEAKRGKDEDKLKLVKELEGKISDIQKNIGELVGTRGWMDNKLETTDMNIIGGTVDPQTAVNGSWQVEVEQLAQKPSAVSNGFPDRDKTEVGVGYFKFRTPEGTKEVYVNKNNSTLDGVAKSINGARVGLMATVINDRKDKENPYKLLVSGLATGDERQVEFPTVYMLDGDQDMYFDESRPAQNGKLKIDGFEIEFADNQVKDLIPGVTLELKQASPGRPINVTVKENLEVIAGKVKKFVEAYNGVLSFIQSQNKLNEKSDTSRTLGGDGMLRTIESDLRRTILDPQYGVESSVHQLSELGIVFSRNGTLEFSEEKFNAKLMADPVGVQNFLRGDGFKVGFVPAVKRQVSNMLNIAWGPVGLRKKGLQDKIDDVNKRIDNKTKQIEKKEESLRKKFADLEMQMSKLNAQGAQVGAIASSMGGGGR